MKKIALFILVLGFMSCSSDSANDNSNGTLIKKVKKINNGVVDTETTYEYNSEGNISKLTSLSSFEEVIATFNYDSNGNLIGFEEVNTNTFNDVTIENDVFNYSNGLVTTICIELENVTNENIPDYSDKIEYVYNGSGNAQEIKHYEIGELEFSSCNDLSFIQFTELLEYDGDGNMIYYETDGFFGPQYYTYSYDNNNHPFANVKPEAFRKLYGFSTNNNITSAIEYDADTDQQTATITYDYVYNNNGYPTMLTRTYDAGVISQTIIYEYSYY